jgi:hypothetical protein
MSAISVLATGLAANRTLFGVGYLAAPARAGGGWFEDAAEDPRSAAPIRALGARDLVLGLGALWALRGGGADPRAWFAAHAVSDGVDLVATLAAHRHLSTRALGFASAMAGVSTAIALSAALAPDS